MLYVQNVKWKCRLSKCHHNHDGPNGFLLTWKSRAKFWKPRIKTQLFQKMKSFPHYPTVTGKVNLNNSQIWWKKVVFLLHLHVFQIHLKLHHIVMMTLWLAFIYIFHKVSLALIHTVTIGLDRRLSTLH